MTQVMIDRAVMARHYLDRGIAHFRQNQFDHAIAAFDTVLQLEPASVYAGYNRATALLSKGDYAQGFKAYEAMWRLFHWRGFGPVGNDIDRLQTLPHWRGETGARLLAYHEMGFGDAIMAMRFLPELAACCDVTLVLDPCLARLARSFDVEVVHRVPLDLSGYDARLPFFGVMAALGITEHTIPNAPYIPNTMWYGEGGPGNKVGIAWSGRTQTDFTLDRFLSLFAHGGFELYSLQLGPPHVGVEALVPGSDFADVADRISVMDHIVCVDTAAVHLAGAMGHPSVHLVLPFFSDWRWHHTERWYPRIKTYRQDNEINWSRPFAKLNEVLHGAGYGR